MLCFIVHKSFFESYKHKFVKGECGINVYEREKWERPLVTACQIVKVDQKKYLTICLDSNKIITIRSIRFKIFDKLYKKVKCDTNKNKKITPRRRNSEIRI